jgi:hypothetical protein
MPQSKHLSTRPEVGKLVQVLNSYGVRYVIIGSVAAQLYGVDVQPGDFDITPSLDQENLIRLAQVLTEIQATLPETDEIGTWQVQPDGERKWVSRKATIREIQERAEWIPAAADISTLDNLFYTLYGNFDVVPNLAGEFETLMRRAQSINAQGQSVWVTHIDGLLAALTVPRRQKDIFRVRSLRELQRQARGKSQD